MMELASMATVTRTRLPRASQVFPTHKAHITHVVCVCVLFRSQLSRTPREGRKTIVIYTWAFGRASLRTMNTARLDVSDPALADAVIKVRSDTSPETFCLFGYEGKSKIVLKECGTGSPYSAIDSMEDEVVSYALLRITGTRDQESKTVKFVWVVYVGPSVGGMARGRVGAHKGDIKAVVGQSHVDIQTDDKTDLTEEACVRRSPAPHLCTSDRLRFAPPWHHPARGPL